jgi:hypothetical protein
MAMQSDDEDQPSGRLSFSPGLFVATATKPLFKSNNDLESLDMDDCVETPIVETVTSYDWDDEEYTSNVFVADPIDMFPGYLSETIAKLKQEQVEEIKKAHEENLARKAEVFHDCIVFDDDDDLEEFKDAKVDETRSGPYSGFANWIAGVTRLDLSPLKE